MSQGGISEDLPVAYASRTLNDAETRYATIEKELLANLFGVENFRPNLYGRKFTLVTDHRPLVWLHTIKMPGSKLNKWRLRLREYDYDVIYKPGRINANADALSRNPVHIPDSNKLGNAETETLDETALNTLKPTSTNLTTHNIFSLRDREQILAFDGTVLAPDFDYLSNNLLVTENVYLSRNEDNQTNITDLNDDDSRQTTSSTNINN